MVQHQPSKPVKKTPGSAPVLHTLTDQNCIKSTGKWGEMTKTTRCLVNFCNFQNN